MYVAPVVKQTWIVTGVLLSSINQGFILSYPFCLLPALMSEHSPIQIDLNDASWLTSSAALTSILGMLGSTVLMDRIGRRYSNAILIVPGLIGWILIYFAENVTMLMIGRLLGGISSMASYVIGCCVMAEYTTPRYRGVFLDLKTVTYCIGTLIMHVMSFYFDWRTVALICLTPMIGALVINCTWTESPAWLAFHGHFQKSEETFYWLRGTNQDAVRECEAMIQAQKERIAAKPIRYSRNIKVKDFLMKFTRRNFVKPISVQIVAVVMMEACGRHYFPTFADRILGSIFKEASNTLLYTLCLDLIAIIGNAVSCVIIKFFKRRTLIFCSGTACLVFMIIIYVYGLLMAKGMMSSDQPTIMVSLLLIMCIFANCGASSLPLVLYAEIFPLEHRESTMAVTSLLIPAVLFAVLWIVPLLLATVQVYGTYGILAIVLALSLLYLYFALPETSNRTLQDIESDFNKDFFVRKRQCDSKDGVENAMLNT